MATVNEKMTAIADAIRNKTGETEPLTLDEMANGITTVYEAGKQAEKNSFWDNYQNNGKRVNYNYGYAGIGWSDKNFVPDYSMSPTAADYMFARSTIKESLFTYKDKINFSQLKSFSNTFYYSSITKLGVIDMSIGTEAKNTFAKCTSLTSIEKWIVNTNLKFSGAFTDATSLTTIEEIEGVIGQNGLDLSACPLDVATLNRVIAALKNGVSSYTLTLGTSNLNKLTDAEKAVATQKGWSLA